MTAAMGLLSVMNQYQTVRPLLAPMAERGVAKVAISVTTLDRDLARSMEPRASSPDRRLDAIRQLSEAGIPTTVLVAPL